MTLLIRILNWIKSWFTVKVKHEPKPTPTKQIIKRIPRPNITELMLDNHNRPALRNRDFYTIRELKAIVLHWTANTHTGADAEANRNYFNTTQRKASAHFIVDDKSIIQCLPVDEVGYHVGDRNIKKKYKQNTYNDFGLQIIGDSRLTPNFYTIGIEMCANIDGNLKDTYLNTIDLVRWLRDKYGHNIPLVRHYDVTGKPCPKHKVAGKWKLLDKKDWRAFQQYCQI